jgi:photosystem II stability/assembly factor-like uncharacterized protein
MSSSGARRALVLLTLACATTASAARLQDNFFAVTTQGPDRAWLVGNFGAVFASTDGGRTWRPENAGTKTPLFGVDFADETHGWIVGQGGLILHTTDGGATWAPQTSPVPGGKHFFEIEARDRNTAWAVGDWGAIAMTTDGGATWRDRSLGILTVERRDDEARGLAVITDDVILYDVEFADALHGAIAGEFGTVFFTRDGGATWWRSATGTDKTLFGIALAGSREAWAVGIDGIILHTTDAGDSWTVQHGVIEHSDIGELSFTQAVENPGLYEVDVQGRLGVVVGDTGALFISTDGGASWQRRELPGKNRLVWMRDVSLARDGGVLVGAAGFTATVAGEHVVVRGATPTQATARD